jgi:rubrerythrin
MTTDFSNALNLIRTITSTAKRLADTREEVKVNEVAIQLQGIVLDLQAEMMMIQSDYQNVLRSKEELEKKLIEQEAWDKEGARYHLNRADGIWANYVYALNVTNPAVEPPHWLCSNCYQNKKKSILQARPANKWHCPRCNTEILMTGFPK